MHRLAWLIVLSASLPAAAAPRPATARAILAELNDWCRNTDDCDVSERPRAHPGRIASGETNGWIASHRESLARLGVYVDWNPSLKRFVVGAQRRP